MTKEEIKKRIAELDDEIEILNSRSTIIKIAINSIYGCLGSNFFRYYDTRISSAVTWQGQLCARGVATYMSNNIENISWKYSDTDSVFFSLSKIVKSRFPQGADKETIVKFLLKYQDKILEPTIHEFFEKMGKYTHTKTMTIVMEHECIADVSIFVEKKKYVMQQLIKEGDWFLEKPKLKIKGIEVVRSSTPQVVRDQLKKALELIFKSSDNDALIEFINAFRKHFNTLPFESVASPRGVKIENYTLKSNRLPIQVRAALHYNKALSDYKLVKYAPIGEGDKLKFCYIKTPNVFGSDVFACKDKMPKELINKFTIDYDLQFNKVFEAPLTKIFSTIGWVFSRNETALTDFF